MSGTAGRERIFLYGTLRRGGSRDARVFYSGVEFVGAARVRGVMHDFTDYPGLRLDPAGAWVTGEIFLVTPEALVALDEWEGIEPGQSNEDERAGEYRRVETSVELADGSTGTCWVYEVNARDCAGRPVIASGDWLARESGR